VQPTVELVFNRGFKKHELTIITGIIEENTAILVERWKEFFKGKQDASLN